MVQRPIPETISLIPWGVVDVLPFAADVAHLLHLIMSSTDRVAMSGDRILVTFSGYFADQGFVARKRFGHSLRHSR